MVATATKKEFHTITVRGITFSPLEWVRKGGGREGWQGGGGEGGGEGGRAFIRVLHLQLDR